MSCSVGDVESAPPRKGPRRRDGERGSKGISYIATSLFAGERRGRSSRGSGASRPLPRGPGSGARARGPPHRERTGPWSARAEKELGSAAKRSAADPSEGTGDPEASRRG